MRDRPDGNSLLRGVIEAARLLLSLAATIGVLLPHLAIEMGGGHASDRGEAVVVNDTGENVGLLGVWRAGGEWSSVASRNVPWQSVVRLSPGEARYLLFESEGADSVGVVVSDSRGIGFLLLDPSVADTQRVSAAKPFWPGSTPRPYSPLRMALPLLLAAVVLASARATNTGIVGAIARAATLLAFTAALFGGILALDQLVFGM